MTVNPGALAFTSTNWDTAQTATVSAEHDRAAPRHTNTTACDAAGYSATLAIARVQPTVTDVDAPPPSANVPTEVRAEATAAGLLVTWAAATGATSYKVQWRIAGQAWSSSPAAGDDRAVELHWPSGPVRGWRATLGNAAEGAGTQTR